MARAMKRNLCLGVLLLFLICINSTVLAASSLEGFAGAPWASREQVQAAIAEKGFMPLEQIPGVSDKYKGSFAGHPDELKFSFHKNVFYNGKAIIRDIPAPQELGRVASSFEDIKKLFIAKYGQASLEYTFGDVREDRIGFAAKWNNLATAATPTGQVSIFLAGIKKRPQIDFYGIIVTYDIGKAWAGLKVDGGSI